MMNRVKILGAIVALLLLSFYYTINWVYGDKPEDIKDLDDEITELNEELITAQILANKLDRVYALFEENMAENSNDSLATEAAMPFLNSLTTTLDSLGIVTIFFRPKPRIMNRTYIETPYDLEIRCNYLQLGRLMSHFERSLRLIKINEFHVKNGVERLKNTRDEQRLANQNIELKISTLTLIRS